MAEWDWDKEGNQYIEEILKELLPFIFTKTEDALKDIFERSRFFISFNDLSRYIISALEEKVRLTDNIKEFLYDRLSNIYKKTVNNTIKNLPIKYEFGTPDEMAIQYALSLHDFYLGNFFRGDTAVRQRVVSWMSRYYLEQGNPIGKGQKGIKEFLEQFKEYIKPQTEWKARQIIDTSVNFLRNSARLRAIQKAGIKKYKWDAIGDRLTCSACRSMDGRIFSTSDAVRILDIIESSQDPTIIKELRPIITQPFKDSTDKAPVKTPPLHPHCRCVIVSFMEEIEYELPTTVERPQNVPDTPLQRELEEEYSKLTKSELTNRIKAHLESVWARPPANPTEKDIRNFLGKYVEKHFEKHHQEVGVKTIEEYKNMAYYVIRNPDRVYVERRGNSTSYIFYKEDLKVVCSDDNMSINSLYREGDEAWIKRVAADFNSAIIRIL